MKTTLRKLKESHPSPANWNLLISNVGNDLDRELPIREILESNGIKDAIWALRFVNDQKSVRLFAADIAESVLHIFEERYPGDERPRLAIKAARDFANGEIGKNKLSDACFAAYDAAYTASIAYDAAYAVGACATWNADWDVASTATYAAASAVGIAAEQGKWNEIEKLLLKYL